MWKKILRKIILYFENRKKKKAEKKHKLSPKTRRAIWAVCLTGILTVTFTLAAFLWYVFVYVDGEYDLANLDNSLNYTTTFYGTKNGETVEVDKIHGTENRTWVNIEDIPKNLQNAFVAIEDERFYTHNGVDTKRMVKAVLNFFNPFSKSSFGGSTITQQVIKNLTGDDDYTVTRKIQEMRRAWYLESRYKKEQILEVYLNVLYLSEGCNGVQTAAQTYFGKDAKDLTLAECACIASITKYPSLYDPLINPDKNKERSANVLNKMVELGYISKDEATAAKAEELKFTGKKPEEKKTESIKSYFVDAVTDAVISDLVNKKGYSKVYAESLIYSGGLQIYTTMDTRVQDCLDSVYENPSNFPSISARDKNGKTVKPQSAMAIVDNSNGSVVALYGGIGKKESARGHNRATSAYRQPGSSIKPLSTYAPAIEYGVCVDGNNALSPSSMIMDWYIDEAKKYPQNQSRVQSHKKVTLMAGVAQSLNTVAARVNKALGSKRSINFLTDNLGFTSIVTPEQDPAKNDQNIASLALGGLTKGVNVVDMAAAYASFPNNGTYTKPYLYTKVVDRNGRVILENTVESHSAMSEQTAKTMNKILAYAASSGTGTPANFETTEVAGKTGTTSNDYDRWFAGYTSYYSGVVWYGYDYSNTIYYGGANPAAVAWKKVMTKVHSGFAYKSLDKPENLVKCEYCFETGKLLGPHCSQKAQGEFLAEGVPTVVCDGSEHAVKPTETPKTEEKPADNNKNPTEEKPKENNTDEQTKPDEKPTEDTGETEKTGEKETDDKTDTKVPVSEKIKDALKH